MNLCFFMGNVAQDVTFDFLYKSKKISMAKTSIILKNNCMIIIKGYESMADWMYHYLETGDRVFIEGTLNDKLEVVVKTIRRIK